MLLVFIVLVVGNFKVEPIVRVFVVRLFNFFRVSTVVLYLVAILYRVSPFWIVYVFP